MSAYAGFERESRTVRNHAERWNQLKPIGSANDDVCAEIIKFCERKRITFAALEALGTRVCRHHDYGICLAYAATNGDGHVPAIKYRPINGTSHDSFGEEPSVWLRPIIVGNRNSLDWLIAEGETDAARLFDLVGDSSVILVLPTGARAAFKPEWVDLIPRGATVVLCHDADEDGDRGADRAARAIRGRTIRVRPPIEGGDWCDWDGDREAFLKLARPVPVHEFVTYDEFTARELPVPEILLGKKHKVYMARGCLFMVYGPEGCGKSTLMIDGIVHLAAGVPWLGIPVPRPVRICIIENEGPPGLFQEKLQARVDAWDGRNPRRNLFVYANPWGEFDFGDGAARIALNDFCDEHNIDLVAANPTLGLGVGTSGRPDETKQFVDLLRDCGLWGNRAFWLNHHENKQGQISGDWGRHPDTNVLLKRDGNRQRTKLTWHKPRWATLEPEETSLLLERATESCSYSVVAQGEAVFSDMEIDALIAAFLHVHPFSSTNAVLVGVAAPQKRVRVRLNATESPFDCVKGQRNSMLWFVRNDPTGADGSQQSFDCCNGSAQQSQQSQGITDE